MKFSPGKVFVGMSFIGSPEKSKKYQAIVRACEKHKLQPSRVDELPGSGHILAQIFEAIEDGEFLIFDLTDQRPNVYYELGYAHGVGNEPDNILLLAKQGAKIHFNVVPLRILYYSTITDLESKVASELGKLLSVTRAARRKVKKK